MIVVKHNYIAGRGPRSGGKVVAIGKALAHMKYIQHRPGPDREKGGRELFNDTEDNIDAKEMREAIKRLGGNRVVIHKLTLAPEINVADKKGFTREVMEKICRDKGQDLIWIGAAHNNTDHHHVHVMILGKDRNGTDVRIDMRDIERAKEYGDRYLDRWQPREMERSRREREEREKARRIERGREPEQNKEPAKEVTREATKAARDPVKEGPDNVVQLPWMNRKIVREQIEPYRDWVEKQKRLQEEKERAGEKVEKPLHQDTIYAAGKDWSRADSLEELRSLNTYLWDNIDERIPKGDYKTLSRWIKEKEQVRREIEEKQHKRDQEKSAEGKNNTEKEKEVTGGQKLPEGEKEKFEQIEYKGETYKKQDPYNKLTGLLAKTREDKEEIPFDDYQKIRMLLEDADRAKWSGALEKQLELTHKQFDRSKTMEQLKEQEGGRVLNPLQEAVTRNPIFGVYMQIAGLAKELVKSIPLDDRLRDPLKEGRDELEAGKKGIDERELERMALPKAGMEPEQLRGLEQAEKKDRDNRERIEQDIEKNKIAKHEELKKQKKDRETREPDYDTFDPWGMY